MFLCLLSKHIFSGYVPARVSSMSLNKTLKAHNARCHRTMHMVEQWSLKVHMIGKDSLPSSYTIHFLLNFINQYGDKLYYCSGKFYPQHLQVMHLACNSLYSNITIPVAIQIKLCYLLFRQFPLTVI